MLACFKGQTKHKPDGTCFGADLNQKLNKMNKHAKNTLDNSQQRKHIYDRNIIVFNLQIDFGS